MLANSFLFCRSGAGYTKPQNSFVDSCSDSTSSKVRKERSAAKKNKNKRKAKRSWMPWS